MRALRIMTVVAVLAVTGVPGSVQAGWNQWARFFGEYWSDGYHAPGDPWNCPPQSRHPWHHAGQAGYVRPIYYPPVVVPHEEGVEALGRLTPAGPLLEPVPE